MGKNRILCYNNIGIVFVIEKTENSKKSGREKLYGKDAHKNGAKDENGVESDTLSF